MPTIRDLTVAIRQRPGIEAVVILGRDGLLIDSQSTTEPDAQGWAARVPGIGAAADGVTTACALADAARGVQVPNPLRGHRAALNGFATHSTAKARSGHRIAELGAHQLI